MRVRFPPAIARRVREYPNYFIVAQEEREDGLLVTLRVREPHDILPWLLSWGGSAHVLEPDSVRQRLADEAAAIIANNAEMSPRS